MSLKRNWFILTIAVSIVLLGEMSVYGADPSADDAALARTRKQVRMLDDLYKTVVVLVTDKYVHTEKGSAAVALFAAMKKKGWHEVRLIDATDDPVDPDNLPKDDFERTAVKRLKSGETYYEQIAKSGDKRFLRAATPVPVVMKKCIMCHEHYKDVKEGAPIGVLSCKLQIE